MVDIVPYDSTDEQQQYGSSTDRITDIRAGRGASRGGERPAVLGAGRAERTGAGGRLSLRQRARLRLGVGAGGQDEGGGVPEAAEAAEGQGGAVRQQGLEDGGLGDCVAHHPRINLAAKLIKQVGLWLRVHALWVRLTA